MGIKDYTVGLKNLFHHNCSTEDEVKSVLDDMYNYVRSKNEGKCSSKQLFDDTKRVTMISKFCEKYFNGIEAWEMCQTKIMRKFAKHTKENNEHSEFICGIIGQQIKQFFPEGEPSNTTIEPWNDPRIHAWFLDFDSTIINSEALKNQKAALGNLPKKYREILSSGRSKLGTDLVAAVDLKFLTKEMILSLQNSLSNDKLPSISQEELALVKETLDTKNPEPDFRVVLNIQDYFELKYKELIQSGDEHKETFRNSLKIGLERFSKDPRVS